MSINQNKLAKQIALKEGLKEQVSIAQIKEILRIVLGLLSEHGDTEILRLISKFRK